MAQSLECRAAHATRRVGERHEAFGRDRVAAPLAGPVCAGVDAGQRAFECFEPPLRSVQERARLGAFEADRRPIGVVFVVGLGELGLGDDRVELGLQRLDLREDTTVLGVQSFRGGVVVHDARFALGAGRMTR